MEHRLAEALLDSVERGPNRPAVTTDGGELSYAELGARARALSRAIQARVPAGSFVALNLPQGLQMVVAIVATVLAGCAYVPLDLAHPRKRREWCVSDAGVGLVVGEAVGDAPCLGLDEGVTEGASGTGEVLRRSEDGDAAYVIYTSGSTGTPKGVVVEHRSVTALFEATADFFAFGPDDVWTMFHSPSFDFSVWEMWGALLFGGRLVLVDERCTGGPAAMADLLRRERITVLNQTPTAFAALAAQLLRSGDLPEHLRWVVFGGERLEPSSLRAWAQRWGLSRPALVNMYGITEVTVHSTMHRIVEADLEHAGRSVIGRPLPGSSIQLVDEHLAPVPDGASGQMAVHGPGVARGYLHRPELTAERFVDLDLGDGEGTVRCYLSGDLARWQDGDLVFEGRIDVQVKLRGYRIEPHEVEIALAEASGIPEACVVVANAGENDDRLVAFVAVDGAGAHDDPVLETVDGEQDLRASLRQVLPGYMVPSHLYAISRLPRTSNGKVDVQGLSRCAGEHLHRVAREPVPGEGSDLPLEERVASLGRRVLSLRSLDLGQDIFDAGATSLGVVRLLREINATFGVRITPADLVADSTLGGIGRAVSRLSVRTSA